MVITIFRDKYSFRKFRKLFLCMCPFILCRHALVCAQVCICGGERKLRELLFL